MKLIILGVVLLLGFISVQTAKLFGEGVRMTSELRNVKSDIVKYNAELAAIDSYKNAPAKPLTIFYVEILNKVKSLAGYYEAIGNVQIVGAKDLVNIEQFFKDSVFHGVKYVDVLCRVDFKGRADGMVFDYFYEIQESNPVEIIGVKIEKTVVNIQMRLYGV
ncbi:MAG TPA: hypothetical protein DCL49_04495 [Candidatus Omnitrophica bacterium]|nr:hypothetical protein [Candidatus Omnitrophota bacterium]